MIASADIAASINFRRWTARGRQAIVPIQKPHIGSIALKIDADSWLCEPSPCAGSPLSSLVAGMASVAASALRSVQRHVAPRVPVARSEKRSPKLLLLSVVAFATLFAQRSSADESGVSFWQPGTFANLAAVAGPPGWSFSATYFHATLLGGSNVATADTLPRFPRTTLTVQLDADIKTNVDIAILTPAYTFATPIWGGRFAFNLFMPVGTARTEIDALVTGALGPIGFAAQNSISDRLNSFGDPAPQLSLKWNQGANNFMVYSRGGIPVGDYNADRIVNLGKGHGALDNGFGYTYFNQATGLEPIPKVVESDKSFVIRYAAPESSTGGCRDVET